MFAIMCSLLQILILIHFVIHIRQCILQEGFKAAVLHLYNKIKQHFKFLKLKKTNVLSERYEKINIIIKPKSSQESIFH